MDKLKYDPLNTGGNREGSVGALPSLFLRSVNGS